MIIAPPILCKQSPECIFLQAVGCRSKRTDADVNVGIIGLAARGSEGFRLVPSGALGCEVFA